MIAYYCAHIVDTLSQATLATVEMLNGWNGAGKYGKTGYYKEWKIVGTNLRST